MNALLYHRLHHIIYLESGGVLLTIHSLVESICCVFRFPKGILNKKYNNNM